MYLFLKEEDILFLHRIVEMFSLDFMVNAFGITAYGKTICPGAETEFKSTVLGLYISRKKANLGNVGYTVLDSLVDPCISPFTVHKVVINVNFLITSM